MNFNLWGCLYWCDRQQENMGATASTDCPQVSGVNGSNVTCNLIRERERRKKVTGFATLRKKLIRRRRSSKTCDHGRVLREFVSNWSPSELLSLLEEYESLSTLKDLSVQAELARPPATTFKQDLSNLYDCKICTDCELVFRGTVFPVHRALLSARCPYFRDLLSGCPGFGARICLELRSSPVDIPMFSSLLRYLYTGDLCQHDPTIDVGLLRRLGEDFGVPNPLEHDLRYLLETGDYADAALVFTSETNDCHRPDSGSSEYGFPVHKLELPCHKAILSARSPFFRGMIQRRLRTFEEHSDRVIHVPTRIILDESVIPKKYARVLLHAIYLDTVDLSLIIRGNGCGNSSGSLGEVQAISSGRMRLTPLEEAMELYQIGRFLELDILSQGCEDLILEWLTLESLPMVLKWGIQPHGSSWVYRQACHYLREEFSAIATSSILHQLDKTQLIETLQNDFLQASELEILQAVLKWGEQELIRRMEDREPNLLSHTAHSVTRKGIKKRDLSDIELREILSELLPHVRMDHVLPPNNEILQSAIRRGLVSTPPSHMIGDDRDNLRINAWIRGGKNHGLFVRPRLFMPYYDELKSLMEDHNISQQLEMMRMRRSRHFPDIPDTLYMVSRLNRCSMSNATVDSMNVDNVAINPTGLDVVAASTSIPVPDSTSMVAMQKREKKLRQSPSCQRALALPLSSKHEIIKQIRLRVVREFNFPDEVSILLENVSCFCNEETNKIDDDNDKIEDDVSDSPPSPVTDNMSNSNQNLNLSFPRTPHQQALQQNQPQASGLHGYRRHDLPSLITEGENMLRENSYQFSNDPGNPGAACVEGHLSIIMPDVTKLQISNSNRAVNEPTVESLHLDLGDGSSHIVNTQPQMRSSLHLYGSNSFSHNLTHRPASSSSINSYHHYMTRNLVSTNLLQQQPNQSASSSSTTNPHQAQSSSSSSSSMLLGAHPNQPTSSGSSPYSLHRQASGSNNRSSTHNISTSTYNTGSFL